MPLLSSFKGHKMANFLIIIAYMFLLMPYFANPYSSWERGLNENTNGLIRQYIPKKSNFNDYSDENIAEIQENSIIDPEKH